MDSVIVYDLVSETRHQINFEAWRVLQACDGASDRDAFVATWAAEIGGSTDQIASAVDDVLRQFLERGLVARPDPWLAPPSLAPAGAIDSMDDVLGLRHSVLDRCIQFRGSDATLIGQIDDYLGTATPDQGGDAVQRADKGAELLVFEVSALPTGEVRLVADQPVDHDDLGTLLLRLVSIMNVYAADAQACVTLHAGAVRSPGGQIVLLPAVSGGGKSTLTAVLVAAGWDYLGDEAIGITLDGTVLGYAKRIALDPVGRAIVHVSNTPDQTISPSEIRHDVKRLGGRVGPVNRVVFPTYRPGSEIEIEELSVIDHFDALLANTLNLQRAGQAGLETLCSVAKSVEGFRLVHGDAIEAAAAIADLLT